MRVLVTGATGFLGSHVVEACLAEGHEVTAIARATSDTSFLATLPGVRLVHGELTRASDVARAVEGMDAVIHSAARVTDFGSRRQFVEANVDSTRCLLDATKAARVSRFVFVSTPSVVADGRPQLGIDETHPYPRRFLNLYSETKAVAERMVLEQSSAGFVTCALRPRAVWGPRDYRGFLPKLLARMQSGKLRDLSGGEPVATMVCHAENAARACVLALGSAKVGGRAYFVTDGEPLELWSTLRTIAGVFGVTPPSGRVSPASLRAAASVVDALWRLPSLGHHRSPPLSRYSLALLTQSSTYDTTRAREELGYAPKRSLGDALPAFKRWVDSIGGLDAYTAQISFAS